MNIAKALQRLRPEEPFYIFASEGGRGINLDDLDNVVWENEEVTTPSREEVEEELEDLENWQSPDVNGFLLACYDELGKAKCRELVRDYPDITLALEYRNYPLTLDGITDALTDEVITQSEYDSIQSLWDDYHLPRD